MATIVPIDVKKNVKPHDRETQAQFNVESWFANEVLEVSFGESVGRPTNAYALKEEYLSMFLQNGWSLVSRAYGSESGVWKKTTTTKTEGESYSSDDDGVTETSQTETTTEDGDPYWHAGSTFRLKRRRLQADLVLKSITDTFVNRYNEGVHNDDDRYKELVTLYGIYLNRNETEGNALVSGALDVTGLFNTLYSSIRLTWDAANNSAMEYLRDTREGDIAEIRYKFEALIAKTKSNMVGQGTYNGTVWPTVEAGIRRQMESAIAEAKANGSQKAISAATGVLEAKGDIMAQLVNAKNAIASAIDNRKVTAIELRNTVMQAMLNFMASREDTYPQLQEISQCASQIGFSIGATGNFG